MPDALVTVPTFLRTPQDLEATFVTLESLRRTEPDVELLVVDDGSPVGELVDQIDAATSRLNFRLHRKDENSGFARTVNVGLNEARDRGMDAVLANADLEFVDPWLDKMQAQTRSDVGEPAEVVGARLLFPNGTIQHAGVFYSLLHRCFDHRFKYAPHDLPEAMYANVCPVTAALQLIRHDTLATVGVYDEAFYMGWEDVDYCLRVFAEGGECVYQPLVWAFHFESMFRGRPSPKVADWQWRSFVYLMKKHQRTNFARWVPPLASMIDREDA